MSALLHHTINHQPPPPSPLPTVCSSNSSNSVNINALKVYLIEFRHGFLFTFSFRFAIHWCAFRATGKIIAFYANFIFQFKDFLHSIRNPKTPFACMGVPFTVSMQPHASHRLFYFPFILQFVSMRFFYVFIFVDFNSVFFFFLLLFHPTGTTRNRYHRRK